MHTRTLTHKHTHAHTHAQLGKMEAQLQVMNDELAELEEDLRLAVKGKTKKVAKEDGGFKDVTLNEDA